MAPAPAADIGHDRLVATVQRGFRFGVVGESIRTAGQLVATARRAEDLGYATLLLRDHVVPASFGDQLAPLVALTAAAAATRTLRVGTLVLDNDFRHPVMLAKEAATLDVVSGGRLELGIGAGWLAEEYERAGLTFDPAGVRVDRLAESLRILRGLFAGLPLTYAGTHYSVSGLTGFPLPAQRPHPPILVGAGSRRMLGIAGSEADIVGILPRALPNGTISDDLSERSPEGIARKVDWVRAGAGDRLAEVELSMMISVTVTDDHRAAAAIVAAERGWPGAADQVLDMPSQFIGSVDRIAGLMHERRERYGFTYFVVADGDMDALAPVVARLAGS
jgi:probable F420-dependent oxidoreductase